MKKTLESILSRLGFASRPLKLDLVATVKDADFLPSPGIPNSIFILWARLQDDREIIIETFGSIKEINKIFGLDISRHGHFEPQVLIGRTIVVNDNKFIKYIV